MNTMTKQHVRWLVTGAPLALRLREAALNHLQDSDLTVADVPAEALFYILSNATRHLRFPGDHLSVSEGTVGRSDLSDTGLSC
jgi:hypothetical protein